MPVTTRKANAKAHPGRVVIESQRSRRSKKQIKKNEARAKAAAHAKTKANTTAQTLGPAGPSQTIDQMGVPVQMRSKSPGWTGSCRPVWKPTQKMRPRIQDLPLPKNGRHLQIWYTRFVPLLISWAGTQEDPFGTTGRIDGTVQSLWERVFPDLVINNVEMMIVIIMAENTLDKWRHDIGKAAYRALVRLWDSEPAQFWTSEDRAEYVTKNLKDFRFLYKHPYETTDSQGVFCSHLVSTVFSFHLWKVSMGPVRYLPQVGGLALTAAAVERALCRFKTGDDAPMLLKRGPETAHVIPRAIRGLEFSAKLWGNEAREFAKTTRRLTEKHWEEIVKHATYYVTTNHLNTDDDNNFIKNCNGETVTPNPRAVIDLY